MACKQGFTLIELMVVVAIVAILTAIAIPSYGRYAFRARRPDGQEELLRVANAQERYYAAYNSYADLKTIGYSDTTTTNSQKSFYQVAVTQGATNDWQSFAAAAKPQGVQMNDAFSSLSIDNTGTKLPAMGDVAANRNGHCW